MKEILQPFNASMKGIVNKTEATLIAFDGPRFFLGLWFWQFMNCYLIFPLWHIFPFFKPQR